MWKPWCLKNYSVRVKEMNNKLGWYKYMNKDPIHIFPVNYRGFNPKGYSDVILMREWLTQGGL